MNEIITKDNLPEPIYNDSGKMVDMWMLDHNSVPVHVVAGENQHVLKNGAIYDDVTHRVVKPSPIKITSATALELHQARKEKAVKVALHALACENSKKDNRWTSGLDDIMRAQIRLAKEENAYSTRAAEFVVKSAGLSVDDKQTQSPGGMSITMDRDTAMRVVEALAKRRGEEED